jgi:hypothetical protein
MIAPSTIENLAASESPEELTPEEAETPDWGWLWMGIEGILAIMVWLIWYGSAPRAFWRSR